MFVGIIAAPLEIVQDEQSAAGKKFQHAKSITGEECKTKTLQFARATWNSAIDKKCNTQKIATWKDYYTKKCNIEMMQYTKSATWRKSNMYTHCAQTDNGLSVDGPLYTGISILLTNITNTNIIINIIINIVPQVWLINAKNCRKVCKLRQVLHGKRDYCLG